MEQDKKIQELLQGNFETPSPSPDFTPKIMAKITAQEAVKAAPIFAYEPVISKTGWIGIASLFITAVYLGLTGTQESTFTPAHFIPDFQFETSIANAHLIWFAVLSIFTLLLIDRLLLKSKLH